MDRGTGEIMKAAQAFKEAQTALMEAVRAAHGEGFDTTLIAEAAGVSQSTIHKWVGDSAGEYVDVLQALNEGLRVIANRGTKHGAYQALKALGAPPSAMVSRIKIVTLCAESIRREELPGEDIEILMQAFYVASECQKYFNQHKKYPNKIRRLQVDT